MRPRGQRRRLFLRNLPQGGLEATLVLPRGA